MFQPLLHHVVEVRSTMQCLYTQRTARKGKLGMPDESRLKGAAQRDLTRIQASQGPVGARAHTNVSTMCRAVRRKEQQRCRIPMEKNIPHGNPHTKAQQRVTTHRKGVSFEKPFFERKRAFQKGAPQRPQSAATLQDSHGESESRQQKEKPPKTLQKGGKRQV